MVALALLAIVALTLPSILGASGAVRLGMHAVSASIFCLGFARHDFPVRYVVTALLLILVLRISRDAQPRVRAHARTWVAVLLPLAIAVGVAARMGTISAGTADALFRYIALVPSAVLYGYLLAKTRQTGAFGRAYVTWAGAMALWAVVESSVGHTLVAGADIQVSLVRDGQFRAIGLSEHPILLGLQIAVAVAFVLNDGARRWNSKVVFVAVLLSGIWATGSRGALALALGYLVAAGLYRTGFARLLRGKVLAASAVLAFGVGLVAVPFAVAALGEQGIASADAAQASAEYRLVLYSRIAGAVADRPLGWGLEGLPIGQLVVDSPFGQKDLAYTVDSEIALLAFDAGVLGLLGFAVLAALVAVRALQGVAFASASALILVAGSFVAIHAWTIFPILFAVLVGAILSGPDGRAVVSVSDSPELAKPRRAWGRNPTMSRTERSMARRARLETPSPTPRSIRVPE